MAEKVPQTYANHVRMHPPFHFFLLPSALLLLILTIVNVVRHSDRLEAWILLLIGGDLTESQLVALRFASDAEVAALMEKALKEQMKAADIKKSVVTWRADLFRV
jgi:hypothetical protein